METDLVIRTYRGDFEWLSYCLKSCAKHLTGVRDIVILCSNEDAPLLAHLTKERVVATGPDWVDCYLQQQYDKLTADLYTDADFIIHMDSDCVWAGDFHPSKLTKGGLPIWFYELNHDPTYPFLKMVERDLGFRHGNYSFMRRHPFMWPRAIYKYLRDFLEEKHGKSLGEYIQGLPYREFSEFETMGAYIYKFAPTLFSWVETPSDIPDFQIQSWSWGGIDAEKRTKLEELTK